MSDYEPVGEYGRAEIEIGHSYQVCSWLESKDGIEGKDGDQIGHVSFCLLQQTHDRPCSPSCFL
jgi:hypothetical protein